MRTYANGGAGVMTSVFNCLCAALSPAILICCAAQAHADLLKLDGETMGSYYAVVIEGAAEADAEAIQAKIQAILKDVNRQMSTWDSESEISKFNQSKGTDWFSVSQGFFEVVQESIRLHRFTNGSFDPTLAPVIDLWGFGAQKPKSFPAQAAIDEARTRVGMEFIEARSNPPSIRRSREGITITLSAITPGYASDCVSELLTSLGFPSHTVDIGGEIKAGLPKSGGGKWRLGIESPLGGIQRVVECTERSIATSGDYRNYFEYKGVRYSHAIDPTTCRPVVNPPASVSILCDSAMTADGMATSLMVMGVEKGLSFARQHKLSVLFLDVVDGETIVEHATGEFSTSELLAETPMSSIFPVAIFLLAVVAAAIVLLRLTSTASSGV